MSSSVKSSSSASVAAPLGTVEARECFSVPVEPGGTTAPEVTPSVSATGRVFMGEGGTMMSGVATGSGVGGRSCCSGSGDGVFCFWICFSGGSMSRC